MFGIKRAFEKYLGKQAIEKLVIQGKSAPLVDKHLERKVVLTVAGDQLTGKSTLAKKLIAHNAINDRFEDIIVWSTGKTMRQLAAERNQSIGEFSNSMMDGTNTGCQHIDISIDYRTCELIMNNVKGLRRGKANHEAMDLFMIEGRQPAVMATFCQFLNRDLLHLPLFRIYLTCSLKEQAARYFQREVGDEETIETVNTLLQNFEVPQSDSNATLIQIADFLLEHKNMFCGKDDAIHKFHENAKRDENDRRRFYGLYNKENYYRNLDFYDLVIDTTDISEQEKVNSCIDGLSAWLNRKTNANAINASL